MAPFEASTDMNATPETIWETCFAQMQCMACSSDVREVVKDTVESECRDGAKFLLKMHGGATYPITLSNAIVNQAVTYRGMGTKGTFRIRPLTSTTSRIEFTYQLTGLLKVVAGCVRKGVTKNMKESLKNMVQLCEPAQRKKNRLEIEDIHIKL